MRSAWTTRSLPGQGGMETVPVAAAGVHAFGDVRARDLEAVLQVVLLALA